MRAPNDLLSHHYSTVHLSLYEADQADLSDDLSQARVAHDQPAPRCDAVGLVLELLGVDLVEILEPDGGEEPESESIQRLCLKLQETSLKQSWI